MFLFSLHEISNLENYSGVLNPMIRPPNFKFRGALVIHLNRNAALAHSKQVEEYIPGI